VGVNRTTGAGQCTEVGQPKTAAMNDVFIVRVRITRRGLLRGVVRTQIYTARACAKSR
jgi:hypothetical protein